MTSIGETLRRERLRLGLDLDQVAERTKIGTRLLQAMEADDFEKLPGGVFTRSFVKQYARVLGLDEEAIGAEVATIQQKHDESPPAPRGFRSQSDLSNVVPAGGGSRISQLHPQSKSILISVAWVAVALGVCLAGYFFLNHPYTAGAPEPSSRVVEAPAPQDTTPAPAKETAPPAAPPTPQPSAANPEASAPTAASPVQVLVKASEDSWISVSADGRNFFTGVLQANESKQIDADANVKVVAGNSGGLDISLNGKPIGPIGKTGQRRIVELTAEGAHVVRRTSASRDPLL